MNPQTQEYKEAEQAELNKKTKDFISTLSSEEQKKYEAIENAVKILMDAKVAFYLLPQLPYPKDINKKVIWQWNSFAGTARYNSDGTYTEEFKNELSLFNEGMMYAFTALYADKKAKTHDESMYHLSRLMEYCITNHQKYLAEKSDNSLESTEEAK